MRARNWDGVGRHLTTEAERAAAADTKALVVYSAPDSYDKALDDGERAEIERMMELHAPMDDKSATVMAQALVEITARAAALGAAAQEATAESAEPPVLYLGELDSGQGEEVEVDE